MPLEKASGPLDAESGIVAHKNQDHADAVALYAQAFASVDPGSWCMTGIDPEGCDIALGAEARRIQSLCSDVRNELVRLAEEARNVAEPS